MIKGKGIEQEAERFFKEMGLEGGLARAVEAFTDSFVIKGEETEDLREALRRAPDPLLDGIWKKISGEKPDQKMERREKEERLYEDIPGSFALAKTSRLLL